MLRICLDARNIKPFMTGMGRYALNLVRGLAELDHENEYILLTDPSYRGRIVDQPNFREVPVAGDTSSTRSFVWVARAVNRCRPDVFHSLRQFLPLRLRCPRTLITLHDVMWIEAPGMAFDSRWKARYNQRFKGWFVRKAVRDADVVIAVSEATRQQAIEVLGMPAGKSCTIHPGIDERFLACPPKEARPRPTSATLERLRARVGEEYVLSFGTSRPYKNVDGVLKAFQRLKDAHPSVKLLIVGRGDRYPALERLARELGLSGRVVFWSSRGGNALSDEEIITVYQDARMLAFPSFLEGFGLPIAEAMAVGCPVLTSRISAPAEVAADAGLLVDPYDVDDISAGMDRLLRDTALRARLIERGRRRAARFSIDRGARAVHALYTSSAEGARGVA